MARSTRFQRGLNALGLIVDRSGGKHATTYENSVHCLIKQMKQVLNATKALQDSLDNPIKLTDLHIQLADSYRGSSSLRFAWLQSLATSHFDLKWYSEASVCQAHCLAIIGIELEAKKLIKINWALFDTINEGIVKEYNILRADTEIIQPAGFTIENFTSKAEQLMKNLLMAERYEAVSAVCRMILPIFEEQHNYYRANFICTELQQAYCRLNEIKTSGRRHLASYFKVVFFGKLLLGEDHETEWIYREPGLTPLAEASEKMLESIKHSLGHDNVKLIMEKEVSAGNLKDNVAYVQMTHVHPFLVREGPDNMNYWANTNIKSFYYDEPKIDSSAPSGSSEIAKQLIKKVFVTIDEPFPSMKRRQRVIGKKEQILNPLEVACESLIKKANQIRKVIKNAKDASHFNVISTDNYDKSFLDKLDLKGLQLLLQGSVQATVNAGPLAYGEGFSTTIQMQRYGEAGINKLIRALKQLLYQCSEALKINEIAVASDQVQYQQMLKCSFEALIERLSEYFGEDKMALTSDDIINEDNDIMSEVHTKSIHILDSIAGVMQSK
uniref:DOCKER domain-containing protein n=1 Tax=Rhabditophanes sp. KR3021 TaxID=114890 RepID=A0AC35TWM6_9BILA